MSRFASFIKIITCLNLAVLSLSAHAQIKPIKYNASLVKNDTVMPLEDVLVTAQKRAERLQKIPFAITAINAQQTKDLQIWDIKNLSSIIPNLYAADPGDGRNVTSIRGIATTSYDPTVAVYIDGVNQFSLDTYIPSLHDVERIEVLRGPQGSLYGRNAMGGVINIITKEPNNNQSGFADLTVGNYNQQRINAGIRTPLLKDKLFFGATGLYNSRDGFYTNDFSNSTYDKQSEFSGNYFLHWNINSYWTAKLNIKHRNQMNNGAFPLVADLEETFMHPYHLNQNATTQMKDNTLNSSFSLNYTGSRFNFNALTAYQKNYRYYTQPIDGDFSPYDIISVINNYGKSFNNIKVLTQEFKLSSTPNSKIKWTTGAYLFYQDAPVKQGTHFGEMASMMVGDSLFNLISTTKTIKKGVAVYGQTNFKMAQKWQLTLGIRSDYEKVEQSVLGIFTHEPDNTPYTTTPETSSSTHFNALSPKIALDYQWNDNVLLYSQYSRGFRTGGLSPLSSDPSQPALMEYKPEYSNNFEIGLKSDWASHKLRINIAAFYSKINDAQVPSLILPDAVTITKNVGKLNSKGAEIELTALPLKGVSIQYNMGVTEAKFETLLLSQQGEAIDLKGKRQIFTPDMTSFLAIQYFRTINSKGLGAFVRGEWKYTGNTYFDLSNTIQQKPYNVFNASMGLNQGNYGLKIWTRNLSQEKYISYAYDFGAFHLGDPANFGITLSYNF